MLNRDYGAGKIQMRIDDKKQLEENVKALQCQLQSAYIRIKELLEENSNLKREINNVTKIKDKIPGWDYEKKNEPI